MKTKKSVIFCIIIFAVVILIACFYLKYLKNSQSLSKISDSGIISLLNKNQDAKEYMNSHSDFKIEKKIILTKEDIIGGQNGQNFKEVYQGLELQDNRYMKVDLMNLAGDNGMVTIIDFNNKEVLKAYGIVLLSATANSNGQTAN